VNYSKRIVCLACARRPSGRYVAGRELLESGYGGWIRPVSARPSGEISLEERCYESGMEPQILDIIDIPMIAAVPHIHQTENHLIDAAYYWTKKGVLPWTDIAHLVERPVSLWENGNSMHHGMNDLMSQTLASHFANSILLIEPYSLNIQVHTEVGMLENPRRRVRADFWYQGTRYNFVVTDPLAEQVFLALDADEHALSDVYLCLSLSESYKGDGYCHKLVESILSRRALCDLVQHIQTVGGAVGHRVPEGVGEMGQTEANPLQ
jgi:hypothetical protein